jgi:glutamate-1-semialdehyde 2,1-aminomutase
LNESLYERAKRVLPGGVNSPVRAFRSVGGTPRFIAHSDGSRITDADGRSYIDYVASWGPMILGHNHPVIREAVERAVRNGLSFGAPCEAEVELAELMTACVPGLEMVRMTSSGTEAVMSALRVARHVTGRDKIVKFEGCYHGHGDSMLVKAGSGALTFGVADSGGVPSEVASLTLTARYNDISDVDAIFDANTGQVAALIVEPVAANMGVVAPNPGFLQALRESCTRNGALLIFDEVITGFRLAPGGAAAAYGVKPDLWCFGKVIGGGMPVGAFGGALELMRHIAPLGSVYHAGTLSGNPVAMAAGLAQLRYLRSRPEVYAQIDAYAAKLELRLRTMENVTVNRVGSLLTVFFTNREVRGFADAQTSDTARFAAFHRHMLDGGVYLPPSQFEAWFIGAAHSAAELDSTLECALAFAE